MANTKFQSIVDKLRECSKEIEEQKELLDIYIVKHAPLEMAEGRYTKKEIAKAIYYLADMLEQ